METKTESDGGGVETACSGRLFHTGTTRYAYYCIHMHTGGSSLSTIALCVNAV